MNSPKEALIEAEALLEAAPVVRLFEWGSYFSSDPMNPDRAAQTAIAIASRASYDGVRINIEKVEVIAPHFLADFMEVLGTLAVPFLFECASPEQTEELAEALRSVRPDAEIVDLDG